MDTLTQIALGASVGELVLGRKMGNRAVLWGGIAGAVPDLDILARPFMDPLHYLVFHRSVTHSLLFVLFLSPLWGYWLTRIYRHRGISPREWTWLVFWALITHIGLDCFTSYGTQVFWPFSHYRVAFSTIFVIDPLYSIPLFLSVVILLLLRKGTPARRVVHAVGLWGSTLYLLLTVGIKLQVNAVFTTALEEQHRTVQRLETFPTAFNILLWRGVAQTPNGYYEGLFSLLDPDRKIRFVFVPANHRVVAAYRRQPALRRLIEFTRGFYAVKETPDGFVVNDMRYGRIDLGLQGGHDYIFSFRFTPVVHNTKLELSYRRLSPLKQLNPELLKLFWERLRGHRGAHMVPPGGKNSQERSGFPSSASSRRRIWSISSSFSFQRR